MCPPPVRGGQYLGPSHTVCTVPSYVLSRPLSRSFEGQPFSTYLYTHTRDRLPRICLSCKPSPMRTESGAVRCEFGTVLRLRVRAPRPSSARILPDRGLKERAIGSGPAMDPVVGDASGRKRAESMYGAALETDSTTQKRNLVSAEGGRSGDRLATFRPQLWPSPGKALCTVTHDNSGSAHVPEGTVRTGQYHVRDSCSIIPAS